MAWARSWATVYPRACGGTGDPWPLGPVSERDLSWRVRGNRAAHPPVASIPARAGEPVWWERNIRAENGLSRANGGPPQAGTLIGRSIPARAGEPPRMPHRPRSVLSRACGGSHECRDGLSPRVRGNRWIIPRLPQGATAGERRTVYPRACGGTPNVQPVDHCRCFHWVYPRVSGEPVAAHGLPTKVYPRACGGTFQRSRNYCVIWVYPRASGERTYLARSGRYERSIPARAGEPLAGSR